MSDLRAEIKALPLHDAHTVDILGRRHKPIDQYSVLALIPEGAVLVTEGWQARLEATKREWIDCECQGAHNLDHAAILRHLREGT